MREIIYNGNCLPENCVPGCKITHCHEKAVQDCDQCGTPICNGHASMAVTDGHVCQWCRIREWAKANNLE